MSSKLYSEIIEEFEQADSRKDKIAVLQANDTPRFRLFLSYAFDPKIEFDVEIPKYKASFDPAGLSVLTIAGEIPKFYRFIKDHPQRTEGFGGLKQQNILINILESLHKDEAIMVIGMLKKELNVKYLTPLLIKESYPGIEL
jgi:hypothetical protein